MSYAMSQPLRFELAKNSRPGSSQSLTPCLVSTLRGVAVYRILDAEFREPFVSGSRLLAAAGETPLAGLLRFGLQPGDWDFSLAGLAPFEDIWISLSNARHLADSLSFYEELQGLLDWNSRFAWTVADAEENALRHNWRIPPNTLAEDRYSTKAMLETPFPAVVMLPKGQDVRTHIPATEMTPSDQTPSFEEQWRLLVRWSLLLYEEYLDKEASSDFAAPMTASLSMDPTLVETSERHLIDLLPSFLWSILGNQMQLLKAETSNSFLDKGRAWSFAGGRVTARKTDRDLVAQMALCDALAQLVLIEWQRTLREQQKVMIPEPASEPRRPDPLAQIAETRQRLEELEERLVAEQALLSSQLVALREEKTKPDFEKVATDLVIELKRGHNRPALSRDEPWMTGLLGCAVGVALGLAIAVYLNRKA